MLDHITAQLSQDKNTAAEVPIITVIMRIATVKFFIQPSVKFTLQFQGYDATKSGTQSTIQCK